MILEESKKIKFPLLINFYLKNDETYHFFDELSLADSPLIAISQIIYQCRKNSKSKNLSINSLDFEDDPKVKNLKLQIKKLESKSKELELEMNQLFSLYEETEKRVNELEFDYLNSSYLKDKPLSEILIELWKQLHEKTEMKKNFEKVLLNYEDIDVVKFNEKDYTFISLK